MSSCFRRGLGLALRTRLTNHCDTRSSKSRLKSHLFRGYIRGEELCGDRTPEHARPRGTLPAGRKERRGVCRRAEWQAQQVPNTHVFGARSALVRRSGPERRVRRAPKEVGQRRASPTRPTSSRPAPSHTASEERWGRSEKRNPWRRSRSVLLPLRPTGYAPAEPNTTL